MNKATNRKLGLDAAECLYVDDRRYNLAAAEEVGIKAVLFNSRGVEYDGETVNDFAELARWLEK